jgi:hypothetical protein
MENFQKNKTPSEIFFLTDSRQPGWVVAASSINRAEHFLFRHERPELICLQFFASIMPTRPIQDVK